MTVLCLLALTMCVDEPVLLHSSHFPVSEAQAYFEANAKDLRNVNFWENSVSRASNGENLVPEWERAKVTQDGEIVTLEIPLDGDVIRQAMTMQSDYLRRVTAYESNVTTKLVMQKHVESGSIRQFVATLIDGGGEPQKEMDRNYYGGKNYSGYVIISSLEGKYLASFRSFQGHWTKVRMAAGSKKHLDNRQTVSLRLSSGGSLSRAYNIGESGNVCPQCGNFWNFCTCCDFCDGSGCDSCMVNVMPNCMTCGNRLDECTCCPDSRLVCAFRCARFAGILPVSATSFVRNVSIRKCFAFVFFLIVHCAGSGIVMGVVRH